MTVGENIVLGAESGSSVALDLQASTRTIRRLSRTQAGGGSRFVEQLSVGQQQRVELLKALSRRAAAHSRRTDGGVDSAGSGRVLGVRGHARSGQDDRHHHPQVVREVLAISDEVTVMRDGRVVGRRKTATTNATELARLMVGRDVLLHVSKPVATPGAALARGA